MIIIFSETNENFQNFREHIIFFSSEVHVTTYNPPKASMIKTGLIRTDLIGVLKL